MSINIRQRTDYSTLFAGLYAGSGSTQANTLGINLSDYASLKSGSYGKLMKAYYSKNRTEEVEKAVNGKDNSTKKTTVEKATASEDTASKITALSKSAESLSKAAGKLMDNGTGSVFAEKEKTVKAEDGTETTVKELDRDAIYDAAASFISSYNSLADAAASSNNTRIGSAYSGLTNLTDSRAKSLDEIGIKVGENNKLSIDKDKFNAADIDKVKSLLQGSFSTGVQNRAELIQTYAKSDAAKASGLYGSTGSYTNNLSGGSLYNGIF